LLKTPVLVTTFATLTVILLTYGSALPLVMTENATSIETQLFFHSFSTPPRQAWSPFTELATGSNIRIVFNASEQVSFFCQNSWEYTQSNASKWLNVTAHWSENATTLDRTYTVPTTDTWYFSLVNYEYHSIDIYNITLYRIDTYEIRVESDKQNYGMAEQATLTVTTQNNSAPISSMTVSLQVTVPNGTAILVQNNLTNAQGQLIVTFYLPQQYGQYTATAETTILGKIIEDSANFTVANDTTPPITNNDYDGKWHTSNFTITLTAADNESGVKDTYYGVNGGPMEKVSADGQPQITFESANNTLEYWSIDNAGNEELPHNVLNGIKLDRTPPTGSILLGGNLTYVNSTSIIVTLSASDAVSGVAQMHFSNDNITWLDWETFSFSRNWTLAPGDGPKTVYAQFKDSAGFVSDTCSGIVILDKTVPVIEKVSRVPENEVQPAQGTKILVNATDTGSGVKSVILSYTVDNITWFNSQMLFNPISGLYEYFVPGQQANTQVEYRILAYDNAGNEKIGDNQGQYYVYTVVPEFPASEALMFFMVLTLLAVAFQKRVCKGKIRNLNC
jgi:hypothetical protein